MPRKRRPADRVQLSCGLKDAVILSLRGSGDHILLGRLAGIGFTMSLFIAGREFPDETDFAAAKIGIFVASLIAGGLGTALPGMPAGRPEPSAASFRLSVADCQLPTR